MGLPDRQVPLQRDKGRIETPGLRLNECFGALKLPPGVRCKLLELQLGLGCLFVESAWIFLFSLNALISSFTLTCLL